MICSPWITANDLVDCDCPNDAPQVVVEDSILAASEVLFALSGRQWPGSCAETLRPCSGKSETPFGWPYPWYPVRSGGSWVNIGCGCHIDYSCACGGVPQVDLGRSDVTDIFRVNISGTDLVGAWRLDEGRYLVRTDGLQWPCCQNLAKNLGEEGVWYIELEHGTPPPQMGKNAAKKLASELIKACVGADCELPSRVSTVARQGVTMTLIDPQDFLDDGRTGLYEVDLFLKSVNPLKRARRASAWSPEVKGKGRRVNAFGS